jgi:hypothetical protein
MKKMNKKLYDRTADNKTYKLCHYQQENICCLRCAKRRRQEFYFVDNDKMEHQYPNWKLVSKNKKQWMYKKLNFKPIDSKFYDRSEITW